MWLKKSSQAERMGCLVGILGMFSGPYLILKLIPPPADLRCGNPIIGVAMIGGFFGLFGGALTGMLLSRILPSQNGKPTADN